MSSLYPLVKNETVKMLKKRRFLVIMLIIVILIPVFVYARMKVAEDSRKQFGTDDWHVTVQQQITDYTNRLSSPRVPEEWKKYVKVELGRLQYALEQDIDPMSPNGVTFTRELIKQTLSLFLPLLVSVIGADIVSSEHSTGTIKLLLTRPVPRWRVLLSKLITLIMFVSLILLMITLLSYLIAGIVFGYKGWTEPILTGFQLVGDQLDTSMAHAIQQWQFILMEMGLAWFSCLTVACLSLMVSVLIRSTAAGMGTMIATLIAGTILTNMASSWHSSKYLFMINLQTIDYLTGSVPAVPGLTLPFSLAVLSAWAAGALVIAFLVFTKRDILN